MSELVIAEKPSVGRSIAAVLKALNKRDGYMEGNGYIVTWCFGHLIESAKPEEYGEQYKQWTITNLPIIPLSWKSKVTPSGAGQFRLIRDLMQRPDVKLIICATDAGREGELIFRNVYNYAGCKKPFRRLWVSSMEESAITDGFRSLRDGHAYDALYNAALCRDRADWLVGMNGSRLFSALYRAGISVGRVVSPTLNMIVERQHAIDTFIKEPFYITELDCGDFIMSGEKTKDKAAAETLRDICDGKTAIIQNVELHEKKTAPPKLYDLTTLQREANRLFGYTAQKTLDYIQSLYEKKLTTYPRTDSRYLTEDMADGLPALVEAVSAAIPFIKDKSPCAEIRRVIDNSKVSDHHAIIPTQTMCKTDLSSLTPGERDILNMVAVRLICAVGDPHVFNETSVIADCEGHTFKAKGRTILSEGWKAVEQEFKAALKEKPKEDNDAGDKALPTLHTGQHLDNVRASIHEGFSSPPKPYTEDTLLAAMENAGADEMPEDAERKGIGTPATRAAIIEKLLSARPGQEPFVRRESKALIPTRKGIDTVSILPDSLKSPLMTAEWEHKLTRISKGEVSADMFMQEITDFTRELVASHKTARSGISLSSAGAGRESLGNCPVCGKDVVEGKTNYHCVVRECKFVIWKEICKQKVTKTRAKKLLARGKTELIENFVGKSGKPFKAHLILKPDNAIGFLFAEEPNKTV